LPRPFSADGKPAGVRGSPGGEVLYGPDGSKLALVTDKVVTKAFVPLPGGATAVYNGSTLGWYRHPDWLGSSRIASTPGGAFSYDGAAAYSPFGEDAGGSGTADRSFTMERGCTSQCLCWVRLGRHQGGQQRVQGAVLHGVPTTYATWTYNPDGEGRASRSFTARTVVSWL
jgi:hypothetical protein